MRLDLGFVRANLASRNEVLQWDCKQHHNKNSKLVPCSEMPEEHTKGLNWRPALFCL